VNTTLTEEDRAAAEKAAAQEAYDWLEEKFSAAYDMFVRLGRGTRSFQRSEYVQMFHPIRAGSSGKMVTIKEDLLLLDPDDGWANPELFHVCFFNKTQIKGQEIETDAEIGSCP
jgi:hypothetical protein